jgi:hypothetical protein
MVEVRRLNVKEEEPITNIYDCAGPSQINLALISTLDGVIYLINHRTNSRLYRVDLKLTQAQNQMKPSSLNILYFMGPYHVFDAKINPFLVIHDMKSGLYLLNLITEERTPIFDPSQVRNKPPPETPMRSIADVTLHQFKAMGYELESKQLLNCH